MAGEWQRYAVKALIDNEILLIGDGYRAKNQELASSGLPFARAGNINNGFRFDDADCFPEVHIARVGNKISQSGDVVFTSKGTVGRFAFVRPDTPRFVYSPQLCFWRSLNTDVIEPRFLYYWMHGREFFIQFKGVAGQTDMAEYVSLSDQRRMHISLPPIAEQRAIAHILGTLDDKIELNRKQNETLEAMARTVFKAWFVDFEPVRAKMEGRWQRGQSLPGLPAHLYDLFPDRLVESELGEIPEGWEVSELGGFVETIKGRSYKSEELTESTTALVTLKSFARGGGYRTDGLKPFTGKHKPEQIIEPGEVVVACTDVTQAAELVGRAAIVRKSRKYQTLVASLDTMIVRPRSDRITRSFLYHLGRSDAFVAHTYSHTTGTTVLHLGKDAIPTYRFALPPRDLVHQFDVIASNALSRIDTLEEESERLTTLRDVLLPKLISGELRIADAEAFLKGRG